MKLIESYALAVGAKIGEQYINTSYYPTSVNKYITIHAGTGQPAKNYSFWGEVILLIKDVLLKNGISIIQIGGKDEQVLMHCINLIGQTNYSQTSYVISKSLLHIGCDTWTQHRAGFLQIPLLGLFGSTSIENHSPYIFNKDRTIFLESHRFNKKPSFSAQEFPKTIDLIPPEIVANNIFKLLNIEHIITKQSLLFSPFYQQQLFEIIPNCVLSPNINLSTPAIIRMDYFFDEKFLIENLKIRKCIIITDKDIDLNIINTYRQNIALVRGEIDNLSENWLRLVKKLGVQHNFYTTSKDEDKINKKRLELFNICFFDQVGFPNKDNFVSNVEIYLNKKIDLDFNKIMFKSNKFILSNDKLFMSKSHWKAELHIENTDNNFSKVMDNEDFWKEQNHFYFYTD